MPQGIIVDGQRVLASGVYVENKYSEQAGAPAGAGTVAVVGDFPFLKQNTPYLSTNKLALERLIAPNEPDIMRISRVAYKSSRQGGRAPAGVVLISPAATTAAEVELPIVAGTAPKAISRIWGPRGNSTRLVMSYRPTVQGIRLDVSNRGFSERIECVSEQSALIVAYTADPPVPAPADCSTGFDTDGGGSGELELSKSSDTVTVAFARTIPFGNMLGNTHASWKPYGPVVGTVTVTAKAGMTLGTVAATTVLKARAIGLDADGLPVDEVITLTPDGGEADFGVDASGSFTAAFSSLTEVRLYAVTGVGGTPDSVTDGNAVISGTAFSLNTANGTETVADAIAFINDVGSGFYATTRSGRATAIPLAEMDDVAAHDILASSGAVDAMLWSLNKAVTDQSQLIELDITDWAPPVAFWDSTTAYVAGDIVRHTDGVWYEAIASSTNVEPGVDALWEDDWQVHAGFDLVLGGGTHQVAATADWEAAFNELLFADVHGVVPFSTDDTIIEYLTDHVDKAWGKYQNERTGYYGVTGLSTYVSLVAKASNHNTQRLQRCFERAQITQYNGKLETMETYWTALTVACAANGDRRRSLDRWQPDFVDVVRNDQLASPEFNDALIDLGYTTFYRWPNQPVKLLLENTTWRSDNNEYRVAAASVRSSADLQRDIRETAEAIIEGTTGVQGARAALESGIPRRLNYLKSAGVEVITSWNASTFRVDDVPAAFEISFEYQPNGSKSYVKITAVVAAAAT